MLRLQDAIGREISCSSSAPIGRLRGNPPLAVRFDRGVHRVGGKIQFAGWCNPMPGSAGGLASLLAGIRSVSHRKNPVHLFAGATAQHADGYSTGRRVEAVEASATMVLDNFLGTSPAWSTLISRLSPRGWITLVAGMDREQPMIFRQLFDATSGTYTYLLASRRGGEALIIDPVLEKVDRYLQLIRELDLKLVKAVDTHLHADHITGLGALRDRTRCITAMGEQSSVDVVSMRLADGDKLGIEGLALDVMYTPGHTDDSYSFAMADRVFTGDTLLIRGTGRTDFQNGDPRAQYEVDLWPPAEAARRDAGVSGARLQGRHGQHDRRGKGVQPSAAGAIGRCLCRADERAEPVQPEDDGRCSAGERAPGPGTDRDRPSRLGGHRTGGATAAGQPRHRADRPARTQRAGEARRIPGALHAPYPALQENIQAGGMLHELAAATGKRLVFYCAFGERSAMAVQAAQDVGLATACHIHGGIAAWKQADGKLA